MAFWEFCLRALLVTACVWVICCFPLSWGITQGLGAGLFGPHADQGLSRALYGPYADQGLTGALAGALYGPHAAEEGLSGALATALTRTMHNTWLGWFSPEYVAAAFASAWHATPPARPTGDAADAAGPSRRVLPPSTARVAARTRMNFKALKFPFTVSHRV